jgi:hypothetical protein
LLFSVAVLLCFLAGSETGSAQQNFALVCTPGAMDLVISPRRDFTRIEIGFIPAPTASRSQMPAPGQCAWWDRPLNSQEPNFVVFELDARIWTQFRAVGSDVVSTGVASGTGGHENLARDVLEIVRQQRGNGCFSISAHNSGRGYLVGVSIGQGC